MVTYTLGKYVSISIDWCALRGHVWLLDKKANRWRCKRCAGTLFVSQLDSHHYRPYSKQDDIGDTYGRYYFDPQSAPEVR